MGAHDVFRILAVILAIATVGIPVATKWIKNGWLPWLAVPVIAFLWYWILVGLFIVYYVWRSSGIR